MDTNNLSPQAGKATARDIDIVKKLKADRSDADLDELFAQVVDAKFSVDGLSTLDILLKVL